MDNHSQPTTVFRATTLWTERLTSAVRRFWWWITLRPLPAEATPIAIAHGASRLIMKITTPDEQQGVLCVALIGAVNHHTYEGLIETVNAYYQHGNRRLVLDLRQTTELKLSGLFAFINIARLYNGQPLLDAEDGWLAIGQAAAECKPDLARRVKLLAPSRAAAAALRSVRYGEFFERHADLSSALAAFAEDVGEDRLDNNLP